MTAKDVMACLRLRWPETEYLLIEEAPQASDRGGRKLDLLVIAQWRSRGLERDGVEIKVSYSDWQRELNKAEKADWWWAHTHRFWVAAPAGLAEKIKPELPFGWGLLACTPDKPTKVLVRPAPRVPQDFSWPECVGLMRAAANAGVHALDRARHAGIQQGMERAAKKASGPDEGLRARVREFEEKSGVSLFDNWRFGKIAELAKLLDRAMASPEDVRASLDRSSKTLKHTAERMAREAETTAVLSKAISDHLSTVREVGDEEEAGVSQPLVEAGAQSHERDGAHPGA